MKITFPNGVTVEGTPEQVAAIAKSLGFSFEDGTMYFSKSHNAWLKISEMNSVHIRNAILKAQNEWTEGLRRIVSPKEFVETFVSGIGSITVKGLLAELITRKDDLA